MTLSPPRDRTSARYAAMTNGPLTVLALLMVPVLLAPVVVELPESVERALLAVDYSIWAIFALDYVVRLWLAPRRLRFVRSHLPDLIVVVVPVLRPLRLLRSIRALRLLRLTRLAAFAATGLREIRRILGTRGLNYVLLIVLALTFVAAGVVLELERQVPRRTSGRSGMRCGGRSPPSRPSGTETGSRRRSPGAASR